MKRNLLSPLVNKLAAISCFIIFQGNIARHTKLAGFLLLFIMLNISFSYAQIGAGTAPVDPPTGGFGIDGNLEANTPTANIGDWVMGGSGTGGYVLNNNGTPVNPSNTYHLIDSYGNGDDDMFDGGEKNNESPADWSWKYGGVQSKNNINNATLHFTTNISNGEAWLVFSADRQTTVGESYFEFELLQKTVTAVPPSGNKNGTFITAGTEGGRTVGDFAVSAGFSTNGAAVFAFFKWEMVPGSNPGPIITPKHWRW